MTSTLRAPCDEAVIAAGPDHEPCSPNVGRWVLVATILGSSMAFVDATVVNVALPVIQSSLNASATEVQWVVESYGLFLAALLLLGGSLGDHFGRRRVYVLGVGTFAVASLACGIAVNPTELIVARAVQGIGAALMIPGSLAIISATFNQEQRGQAIGIWSAVSAVATGLGPVAGGWLIDHTSWRAIFFLNLPLAAVVLVVCVTRVPESQDEHASRLDWLGGLLATLGFGGIVYGLVESNDLGFGNYLVWGSLAFGTAALVAFGTVELSKREPMVRFSLFRSATFSGANLLTFFLYAALYGFTFFLPFNLIRVQGYSATAAGAALLPFLAILSLLSQWSGALMQRVGARLMLIVGPAVTGVGFAALAAPTTGGTYWTTFFPGITLTGIGMGITVAPLTTTVMGAIDERFVGIASGINNAISRIGGLLSIAVLSIFVVDELKSGLDHRLSTLPLSPAVRIRLAHEPIKLGGVNIPRGVGAHARTSIEATISHSLVTGFRLAMLICAGLAFVSGIAAAVLIAGRPTLRVQPSEALTAAAGSDPGDTAGSVFQSEGLHQVE